MPTVDWFRRVITNETAAYALRCRASCVLQILPLLHRTLQQMIAERFIYICLLIMILLRRDAI